MNDVWFVTGAGSGIGADVLNAALRAGDRVVATGRNLEKVRAAYRDGPQGNLVFVELRRTPLAVERQLSASRSILLYVASWPGQYRTGDEGHRQQWTAASGTRLHSLRGR
jgi:NAD(P)-dependent dehydrogenase (short-subunit alcohol dehydrogenase family)